MAFPDFTAFAGGRVKIVHQGVLSDDFTLKSTRALTDVTAGLVAGLSGDYEADICTIGASGTIHPIGIFAYDADHGNLIPSPARVHRQVTIAKQMGSYETTQYASVTFALGETLYTDASGKLTNVKPSAVSGSYIDYPLGVVTKVPGSDGVLGFDLKI
jgi:hypothetical protein